MRRGDEVDSVLNRCLIDRATNIRISKQAPSAYLEEIRAELGATLDDVLRSHRLPMGPDSSLSTDGFEEFLQWRQRTLDEALAEVTAKRASAAAPSERSALDVRSKE